MISKNEEALSDGEPLQVAAADDFTVDDDAPHPAGNDFYFTETYWYSFFVPERSLGGWLYAGIRPNAGVTLGGCWIWDASGTDPWEIPFFEQYHFLKLPKGGSPDGIEFATGMTVRTIEPGMAYQLGYSDRNRLRVDLRFDGTERPVALRAGTPPYPKASHFDQTGRVTGTVELDGERIDVDCYAMRDRSWGSRHERGFRPMGYTWMASEDWSALLYSRPSLSDGDEIYAGYVRRGDRTTYVRDGIRHVERDTASGWITAMRLEVTDESGHVLNVEGTAKSRMILPGATNVCVNSALTLASDGATIYGEDQDVWPISVWRKLTRR
ncbi:hypothetical protein [Mycobacterium sp. E1747]|uniref:DUF7065 domain-containing protein n=1 Tax=Mycobacterium sp. E1747 TaxID=1834128 RepID=UPI000ABA6B82|nr:hypothetical protein [Mycobacterium sp. E1747]